MRYYNFCGKEIDNEQICCCQDKTTQNKDKQELVKKIFVFGGIAVAIILAIVLIVLLLDKEPHDTNDEFGGSKLTDATTIIDPFDYIKVNFVGLEAKGKLQFDFYREELIEQFIGICPEQNDDETYAIYWQQYIELYDNIEIVASKYEGLSNGDIIILTCVVPDMVQDKLKSSSKEYLVSGLKVPEIIDVFANIEIEYGGISGDATAYIKITADSEELQACSFEVSPNNGLSNGDEVMVSITNAAFLEERYSVRPKELSKTYTVRNLPSYVKSADQLPIDIVEEFVNRFYEEKAAELLSNEKYQYENVKYDSTLFYVSDGTGFGWSAPYENFLEITVTYTWYYAGSYYDKEACLYFTDILIDTNGIISLSYEQKKSTIEIVDYTYYDNTPIIISIHSD